MYLQLWLYGFAFPAQIGAWMSAISIVILDLILFFFSRLYNIFFKEFRKF